MNGAALKEKENKTYRSGTLNLSVDRIYSIVAFRIVAFKLVVKFLSPYKVY